MASLETFSFVFTSIAALGSHYFFAWKGAIAAAALGGALYLAIRKMMGPSYNPGNVAARLKRNPALFNEPVKEVDGEGGAKWIMPGEGASKPSVTLHRSVTVGDRSDEPILVLHGGPGCPPKEGWGECIDAIRSGLPKKMAFYFFDQRGSGRSSRPIEGWDAKLGFPGNMAKITEALGMERHLEDIERIRRTLVDGTGKITIVAHSFGAFIATMYATEFPERIRRLVLVTPAIMLEFPAPKGEGFFDKIRSALSPADQKAFDAWHKRFMNISGQTEAEVGALNQELGIYFNAAQKAKLSQASGTAAAEKFEAALKNGYVDVPCGYGAFGLYFSLGMRHSYTAAAARRVATAPAPFPTLILHSEHDIQTEDQSRQYLSVFPKGQFTVMKRVGHMPMWEDPEGFAEILKRFLLSSL